MTRKFLPRRDDKAGNTIVEVLIAVAIISSVLVGAFAVSQQSVTAVRDGQEQAEMLQVLQGQVEHVRSLATAQTSQTGGIYAPGNFCINTASLPVTTRISAADNACKNMNGRYAVTTSYNSTTNAFTFKGSWPGTNGNTNSQQLTYRVYPTAVAVTPPPTAPGGSPTPPGGGGDAFFDDDGACGGVGQPSCEAILPGGSYNYGAEYVNQSNNDPSRILGCTWDWGDGTVEVFNGSVRQCRYMGMSNPHTYPRIVNEKPYPQSCNQKNYLITLTMRIQGVSPDPKWYNYALMAFCGA